MAQRKGQTVIIPAVLHPSDMPMREAQWAIRCKPGEPYLVKLTDAVASPKPAMAWRERYRLAIALPQTSSSADFDSAVAFAGKFWGLGQLLLKHGLEAVGDIERSIVHLVPMPHPIYTFEIFELFADRFPGDRAPILVHLHLTDALITKLHGPVAKTNEIDAFAFEVEFDDVATVPDVTKFIDDDTPPSKRAV